MTRERRLRIAMVLDAWDDAANGGVVSTRRFTTELRSRGHTVTVVTTGVPEPGKVVLPGFYVPIAGGVMRKMHFPFAWPSKRLLTDTLSQHDVVHVHFPFFLGMCSITIARRLGIPVVSTFHVQAEHLLYNVGIRSEAWIDRVYRLFLRTVYDRSARVICPSPFAEAELRSRNLRAPTSVISNGVPREFSPQPHIRRPEWGGRCVVISVGRLAREKRHDLVIEAVRRSAQQARIQLVILGDGPLRDELAAQGRGLANPPLFGFVPAAELVRYFASADLCIHASEVEVECMSVLEAMACGLPCLIANSSRSATPQFALSDAFLFQSGDVTDLVEKLDRLISIPGAIETARVASTQKVAPYRIDHSVEALIGIYKALLDQSRSH